MDKGRIKRGWGRKKRHLAILAGVCMILAAGIAGCSKKAASPTGIKTLEKEYSRGQIMVIAATERNRYQNVYTGELWSAQADPEGATFEEKLIGQIEKFLLELAVTNLMADEQEVELTGQEKDAVKLLSQEYYRELSQPDKEYMGASEDDIYELYCEYYRADKLVAELTKNENLEVSDAEAKVIQVQQIISDTREEAERILEQVREENADFAAIAVRNSKDGQINATLEWNSPMDSLSRAAFSLEQDESSGIVEQDGRFYILKCTNAYDSEATLLRKNRLATEKKTKAFYAVYQPFVREHSVTLKENIWDVVDFSQGQGCTADNFFQLYQRYFNK